MTTRTLPITPGGGLSLVHQPTSRHTVQNAPATPPTRATALRHRLATWWRQLDGTDLGWAEQRLLRENLVDAEAYAWLLRTTR